MQQRLEEVKPIAEQQLRDWERQATELNQPNRKFLLAEPILKLVPSYRELIKENTRLKQIITQEIKQLKYEVRKRISEARTLATRSAKDWIEASHFEGTEP